MQGGASGSVDEDAECAGGRSQQRAGAKTGMKGTVGAGSGAPQGARAGGYPSGDRPISAV